MWVAWYCCCAMMAFAWPASASGAATRFLQTSVADKIDLEWKDEGERSSGRGARTAPNKPMERCYGAYGCFSVGRPWTSSIRPINNFPEPPEVVLPVYCLYVRKDHANCKHLVTGDANLLERSGLNSSRKCLFIVHGYLESGNKKWIKKMVEEALIYEDLNVIVVDWVSGSGPPYTQAVANIRLIGVMLAQLIIFLHTKANVPVENCHITGHSLGAHLAGYAGHYLREKGLPLGRITGMDPADPYFENSEPIIRLDSSDALFVDVIHTDAGPIISGGLGLMQPSGHIDFYPNGGIQQPGCGTSVLDSIEKEHGSVLYGLSRFIGCNHIRSYEFFTESFNSACPFLAVQCSSYAEFLAGGCDCSDGSHHCYHMGYKADQMISSPGSITARTTIFKQPERTQAYLVTGDTKPFCYYHYRVTVVISDTLDSIQHGGDRGWLTIQLHGDKRSSAPTRLGPENVRFEPRKAYTFLLGSPWLGHAIKSVTLTWTHSSNVFNPLTWRILSVPALHVNRIIILNLESQNSTVICGEDVPMSSKEARNMFPDARCRSQLWTSAASPSIAPTGIDAVGGVLATPNGVANALRRKSLRKHRGQLDPPTTTPSSSSTLAPT